MLFDKLVKNTKVIPEQFRHYVRKARLFHFDIFSHQTGAEVPRAKSQVAMFQLPFPVTAVEDKDSCCVVADLEREAHGVGVRRFAIELGDLSASAKAIREKLKLDDLSPAIRERAQAELELCEELDSDVEASNMLIVRGGTFLADLDHASNKWVVQDSKMAFSYMISVRTGEVRATGLLRAVGAEMVMTYLSTLEELMLLNDPANFVLEKAPVKSKKTRGRHGDLYSHERPVYTVIKPKDARKIMQLPEPTRVAGKRTILERRAHIRHAHTRTLKAERFGENKGKVIEVPQTQVAAVWHGDKEAVVGKHRYRVIVE